MEFRLSCEVSKDLLEKSYIVKEVSDNIYSFFEEKNYGKSIQTLTIGILCVSPEFDFFFKPRKKYSKKNKLCEYDIKMEYSIFKNSDQKDSKNIILNQIAKSFFIIDEFNNIMDFDSAQLGRDFDFFLKLGCK